MAEYLVLLKLNPGKIIDTVNALRGLPDKPSSGVDIGYTPMNIFGTWDVGLWISAENTNEAVEFVHKKIKAIPGVADVYTLPTFPHGTRTQRTRQGHEESTAEKPDKPQP
ncbi:hypothetical protein KAU93_01055 [Candidatus Bathyarchaeota archaeon]|nr:hypothetical protein [Candidatus Bathyarchaeota archaeon]